jgi:hypothetical protein
MAFACHTSVKTREYVFAAYTHRLTETPHNCPVLAEHQSCMPISHALAHDRHYVCVLASSRRLYLAQFEFSGKRFNVEHVAEKIGTETKSVFACCAMTTFLRPIRSTCVIGSAYKTPSRRSSREDGNPTACSPLTSP